MTWVRLEDDSPLHPKLLKLSDGAFRLWIHGLAFCNRGVTDGRIDKSFLYALGHHGGWTRRQIRGFLYELLERIEPEKNGLWIEEGDHYRIHEYEHHQAEAMKERVEKKREMDRIRQKNRREREVESQRESLGLSRRDTTRDPTVPSRPVKLTREFSSSNEEESVALPATPSGPSVRKQIETLESAYPKALVEQTRIGCGLRRRNGKLADTVWLSTLETLKSIGVNFSKMAMEKFVEKYADGEKDERYLIGIARGLQRGDKNNHAPRIGMIPPGKHEDFITDMSDLDRAIGEL